MLDLLALLTVAQNIRGESIATPGGYPRFNQHLTITEVFF